MSGGAGQREINERARLAAIARGGLSGPGEVDGTAIDIQEMPEAHHRTSAHAKRATEACWSSFRSANKSVCAFVVVFALGKTLTEGIQYGGYEVSDIIALLLVIIMTVTARTKIPTIKTAVPPGGCVGGDMGASGSRIVCKINDKCRGVYHIGDARGDSQPVTGKNRQEFSGVVDHGMQCNASARRSFEGAVIPRSEDSRCKWQAEIIFAGFKSFCIPAAKLLVLGAAVFDMIGSAHARDPLTKISKPEDFTVWEPAEVVVKAAVAILLPAIAGCTVGAWTVPFPFTVRDINRGLARGPAVFKKDNWVVALPPQILK